VIGDVVDIGSCFDDIDIASSLLFPHTASLYDRFGVFVSITAGGRARDLILTVFAFECSDGCL